MVGTSAVAGFGWFMSEVEREYQDYIVYLEKWSSDAV